LNQFGAKDLVQELSNNKLVKSFIIILLFRICYILYRKNKFISTISLPIFILYRILIDIIIGFELSYKNQVGKGLRVYHGVGVVINTNVVIGKYCLIRHGVTIGNTISKDGNESQSPVIGDNVELGAGAIIVGNIKIGNNSRVGAGAVVTKNVEDGKTVVGYNRVL
jgi:putative colanic acid biosynthesis acetyltransferase WcaB